MQIFQHTTKYVLQTLLAHTLCFSVVLTRSNVLKIDN